MTVYGGFARVHRWVLGLDLKVSSESAVRTDVGNEFQSLGADTEKARVPRTVRVRGSVRTIAAEDRVEYFWV